MTEVPTLYPHQAKHKDRVRAALAKHNAVILCAQPGLGKTRIAKWILATALNREPNANQSGNMLFTVQRRGLTDNAIGSFNEDPALPHGVIMSNRETSWTDRIQVASIDTLISWFCEGGKYSTDLTFDMVIFDECHSNISRLATFLKAHNAKREELGLHTPFIIGLTATPEAKGLADIFSETVTGPTADWLIENKFLCPFRYFQATQGKLDLLVKSGDEFTKDSIGAAMEGMAGDLVEDWKRYAEGRTTVAFFPLLAQAREAQELLRAAGIDAEYVDAKTPDDERQSLFRGLNEGYISYLCNVGIVERGTDIPRIQCIQLCTAIGSLKRYRQMIGRGSRVHPAVTDCIILDHAKNVKTHGFFEDEVEWTLDVSTKDAKDAGTRPTIECPKCSEIYRGGKCKNCGYEPTAKELKSKGLQFDHGQLTEITRRRKSASGRKIQTNEQIMIDSLYKCGRGGRTWRQALAISYGVAEKQGTRFSVPREVTVAGRTYPMLPFNSPDRSRRIKQLFPFTIGQHTR